MMIDVCNQAQFSRLPFESLLRNGVRGRSAAGNRSSSEAEMRGGFIGRYGNCGNAEMAPDGARNLPERNTFLGHCMKRATFASVLECQPKDACRIKPMHSRPKVCAVTYVCGNALLSRKRDQLRNEAVRFACAVDHSRQSNGGRAYTTLG